jgi:hypothetical protein
MCSGIRYGAGGPHTHGEAACVRRVPFVLLFAIVIATVASARADAEPYRVCGHVPITGAAPIPHHEDRFGQFYFDYVNAELGGIEDIRSNSR